MAGKPKQRDRVQSLVADAAEPLTAANIAVRLGIHVTTVRFHLNNLLDDGLLVAAPSTVPTVGRPQLVYSAVSEPPVSDLVGLLLAQLGATEGEREQRAAAAGQAWARAYRRPKPLVDLPDPVTVAVDMLTRLGFQISSATSIFGTHELRICSCPLRELATGHPEIARGVQRGVIEEALAISSPALAAQYVVQAVPDPDGGDCEVTLRLSPSRAEVRS